MIKDDVNSFIINRPTTIKFPIYFCDKLFLQENFKLYKLCQGKKIFITLDKKINSLYGNEIRYYFMSLNNIEFELYEVNATEKNKNFRTVLDICAKAKEFGLKRDSILIGIGGGVLLDMVGLAAAIYRRKIDYIRIPTTLIGLVDAGIGIKVGVNFEGSKNFIGNFYPPLAVFNDQRFLKSLSKIELECGLYEIIKMAIVKDDYLFGLVEKNYKKILNKQFCSVTEEINKLSIRLMLEELEPNLFEKKLRRLVDFGHSFSSLIETSSDYRIPHGMAVGLDMLISSHIAKQRKILDNENFERIFNLFRNIGLPVLPKKCSPKKLYEFLDEIRDHRAGDLNLPLPSGIGNAVFTNECQFNEVRSAILFIESNFKT